MPMALRLAIPLLVHAARSFCRPGDQPAACPPPPEKPKSREVVKSWDAKTAHVHVSSAWNIGICFGFRASDFGFVARHVSPEPYCLPTNAHPLATDTYRAR